MEFVAVLSAPTPTARPGSNPDPERFPNRRIVTVDAVLPGGIPAGQPLLVADQVNALVKTM
jgi:hypothetical protein